MSDPGFTLSQLSVTERRVMDALAGGLDRNEAASSLKISIHTVGHAITAAKEKLGGRTVSQAVATYVRLTFADAVGIP